LRAAGIPNLSTFFLVFEPVFVLLTVGQSAFRSAASEAVPVEPLDSPLSTISHI